MKGASLLVGLAWVSAMFADSPPSLSTFAYVTEQYPPYNHVEKGAHQGQTINLLKRLFTYTKTPFDNARIHAYPWIRAYNLALQTPNTVLFSTTRTPTREPLFNWAGPIAMGQVALIARKDKSLGIETLNDAIERHLSVVVIRGDIGELSLTEAGYPERLIRRALDNQSALHMMLNDRVDLWAYSVNVADWIAERDGHPPTTLEPVYTLSSYPLYFAINKQSDPALITHFQQSIAEVYALGMGPLVYEHE